MSDDCCVLTSGPYNYEGKIGSDIFSKRYRPWRKRIITKSATDMYGVLSLSLSLSLSLPPSSLFLYIFESLVWFCSLDMFNAPHPPHTHHPNPRREVCNCQSREQVINVGLQLLSPSGSCISCKKISPSV